jgi:hypothetical protein
MLHRRKARVEFAFFVRDFGDGKADVFGVVDDLKLLAVDIIICHDLITLVGDA